MKNNTSTKTETPTNEPCPVCGREEEGNWFTPCPSDDCPSHDTMKKEYRVHISAVIALDVAADSEEQAKRIAAAAVYTPASNLLERTDGETIDALHDAGVYIWSDGEGCSGVLDGSKAEVVDQFDATEEQIIRLTNAVEKLASFMGNEEELKAALASSQAADHEVEQTEAFNKYGMQV